MGCSFTPRMTGFHDIEIDEVTLEGTGNRGVQQADDDADDWLFPTCTRDSQQYPSIRMVPDAVGI